MNKKLGRPRDQTRAMHRELHPGMSERTFARYWKAFNDVWAFAHWIGEPDWAGDVLVEALRRSERASDSINVSKYVRECKDARVAKARELIDAGVLRFEGDNLVKCREGSHG